MRKGIGHGIGKKKVPDQTKTAPRGVKTPQDAPRSRSWRQLGPQEGSQNRSKIDENPSLGASKIQDPFKIPKLNQNDAQIEKKTNNFDAEDIEKKPASCFVFQSFRVRKSEAQ